MKSSQQPQGQSESRAIAERAPSPRDDAGGTSFWADLAAASNRSVTQRQLADLAATSQRSMTQRQLAAVANSSPQVSQLHAHAASMGRRPAAPIQRMVLVENADKILVLAPKKHAGDVIDTTLLTEHERALLRARLAAQSNSRALLAGFDKDHPPARSSSPTEGVKPLDFGELDAIGEALTAREKMPSTAQKEELDAESAKIEVRLSSAYLRLSAVTIPETLSTCRDYLTLYAQRLRKLNPGSKAGMADGGGAVTHVITAQDRLDYRADILEDGVWGGLGEADVVARRMNRRFDIFRIDHNQVYRRVTTVGTGAAARANLLHLGNHYVALRAAATEGNAADPAHRIETTGDGNCLYESLACAFRGTNVTAEERTQFINDARRYASQNISDDAIDTGIIGLLSQGAIAGVGSKMHKVMASEAQKSRVKNLTSEALGQVSERFKALEPGDLARYQEKRDAYLLAREAGQDSEATADALGELDALIGVGEAFLVRKSWEEKPKDVALPLDWWQTVQVALGEKMRDQGAPFIALANLVGQFNAQAAAPIPPFKTLLPLLDEMEHGAKNLEAPSGVLDVDNAANQQARIAMFRFQTVDLRAARRNLVRLYQFGEGSAFRSGPGNRPELHYDSYADGEKENLVTPDLPLSGKTAKAEQALLDSFVKPGGKAQSASKPATHKAKQEGLTAIALARRYPSRFGNISAAPHPDDPGAVNVEYYDTKGNPWDQIAPLSFAKGGSPDAMAASVIDHLKNKPFPHRDTGDVQPSGVIVDCTYIDEYDYTRMWAILIATVSQDDLRNRVVEINVPFDQATRKPVSQGKKSSPSAALEVCRSSKAGEAFEIYPLRINSVAKVVPSIISDRADIKAGTHTRPNLESPIYRNHNSLLPNNDSYFMEFYPVDNGGKSNAAEWRLVWDRTSGRLFITPTHYRPWVSPFSNSLRHPFYEIVD